MEYERWDRSWRAYLFKQTVTFHRCEAGHADGFGFLKPDDGGEDLYLSFKEMRPLLHDDRAVVRVTGLDHRGRLEGAVVEVLERNTQTVVGKLYQESGVGFVVPDSKRLSKDIVIPSSEIGKAQQGQIVVAEIIDQPTKRTPPIGRVVEVLGEHMGPGMETDIAIRTHNIRVAWPEAALPPTALVDDAVLVECFQAFIDVANHFSEVNPSADFHISELEVNPFAATDGRIAPWASSAKGSASKTRSS